MIDRQDAQEESRKDNYVTFTKEELNLFLKVKSNGLSKSSIQVIRQIAGYIWDQLEGKINQTSLQNLAEFFLSKYPSQSARHKCFLYTRMFLMYLYKSRMDPKILSYHSLFEKPKNRKTIKLLTSRVITVEDIKSIITEIEGDRDLPDHKMMNYFTQVLFLAYSGQRPVTASRLTVGQFREALSQEYPVLKVEADQDKIRMEHFVPIHPAIIPFVRQCITNRSDEEGMFSYVSLQRWLKLHPMPMNHTKGKFELKDFRKFFEQKSDEIGFTDANKNFIMSHGVSSVNWQSYKQFLPESVYCNYMDKWGGVKI